MNIEWEPLRQIIEENARFVLSSHMRPDADAVGSELAMAGLLEAKGKTVRIVNPSPLPDSLGFLDPTNRVFSIGKDASANQVLDTDVHIVLDTSAWVQLGEVGQCLRKTTAKKVVIDHHVSADALGAVEFKDTKSEATGALVFQMAEALEYPLNQEIATALFCAIATDTGWFRYSSTTGQTMRIIGRLVDLGVRPDLIFSQLYEQRSAARIKLAGCALSRVTLDFEGQLGYTWVQLADYPATGATASDTDELVNECLTIAGTSSAFIAIEQPNKRVKYSFRSRTNVDVAALAEQFGGGGHKQAAGAILQGTIAETKSKVLAAFKDVLSP